MESNSTTQQLCSQMVLLKIKEPDIKLLPLCRLFRPSYVIKCYYTLLRKIKIGLKNFTERLLALIKLCRAFKI